MLLKYLSNISESMSQESDIYSKYTAYVDEHKANVKKAYEWLRQHCLELFDKIDEAEFIELINEHDASKFSKEEFIPYAQKWFGDGLKTKEYEQAWEHHWQNNKHHPEYWDGKDMHAPFILEMICDWLSFGIKQNNPAELITFYHEKAKNDKEKNLSARTKAYIENCLEVIQKALTN